MSEARFVARVSRWRTGLLVLGALGFVAIFAWMFRSPPGEIDMVGIAASYVGIPFFALCAVIGARQLFRKEPVIEVDATGVRWRRWSDQIIPWGAIADVFTTEISGQRMLSLKLVDPSRYPAHGLLGRLAGINRGITGGDISISATGTDRSYDELLAAVEQYAPRPRD